MGKELLNELAMFNLEAPRARVKNRVMDIDKLVNRLTEGSAIKQYSKRRIAELWHSFFKQYLSGCIVCL